MKILVAYASRHGATQGIAERIADTIARRGFDVVLRPVGAVDDVAGYDAVVIGSGAYVGRWLGEAASFVRANTGTLARRPVWLFSSGPTGAPAAPAGGDPLATAAPKEFAEFSASLHPRGAQVFFGAYDPDAAPVGFAERAMKGFMRVMPAIRGALPAGDFRDWPAIDAWAEGIATELAEAAAPAG